MSEKTTVRARQESGKKGQSCPVLRALLTLLLKAAVFTVFLVILFGYVFGLITNADVGMQPSFRQGDLILFYRMADSFVSGDVVLIRCGDETKLERVIAVPGDIVNIDAEGLLLNGAQVRETNAEGETRRLGSAVSYPLIVPDGKLFVLGDNRENALDSRAFGCVDIGDVQGKVIGLFRRRGL